MKLRTVITLVSCAVLCGCAANTINERTAHHYANAGVAASNRGDWIAARDNWRGAVNSTLIARMSDQAVAIAHYEYGRASGVVCAWAEAERALKEAYRLDFASGGPAYKATYELGRMHYARKEYAKAAEQYALLKTELDRLQAETKDPVGYADYLDEYATALEQTGKGGESRPLRGRADQLRAVFPGSTAHTEKTPYGTHCNTP